MYSPSKTILRHRFLVNQTFACLYVHEEPAEFSPPFHPAHDEPRLRGHGFGGLGGYRRGIGHPVVATRQFATAATKRCLALRVNANGIGRLHSAGLTTANQPATCQRHRTGPDEIDVPPRTWIPIFGLRSICSFISMTMRLKASSPRPIFQLRASLAEHCSGGAEGALKRSAISRTEVDTSRGEDRSNMKVPSGPDNFAPRGWGERPSRSFPSISIQ